MIISSSGLRGVFDASADASFFLSLGAAIARELPGPAGVARDTRPSSLFVYNEVVKGMAAAGGRVLGAGVCPTPALAHAVFKGSVRSGVVVTASHNPPEWSGVKVFGEDGVIVSEERLRSIYNSSRGIGVGEPPLGEAPGASLREQYVRELVDYGERLGVGADGVLRVALDPGNGAAATTVPMALQRLGCQVTAVNDEIDGCFRREIEPVPESLTVLGEVVRRVRADFGVAFDSDGDRAVLVSENGNVLRDDYTLALAADYVLSNRRGPVVANTATSLLLDHICSKHGVPLVRAGIGERNVVLKMLEARAVVGGEGSSGGVILPDFSLVRDGGLATVLIAGLLRQTSRSISAIVDSYPSYHVKRAKLPCEPSAMPGAMRRIPTPEGVDVDTADGLRFSGPGWWVVIRPSGTEPVIRVISEDSSERRAEERMNRFVEHLRRAVSEQGEH